MLRSKLQFNAVHAISITYHSQSTFDEKSPQCLYLNDAYIGQFVVYATEFKINGFTVHIHFGMFEWFEWASSKSIEYECRLQIYFK